MPIADPDTTGTSHVLLQVELDEDDLDPAVDLDIATTARPLRAGDIVAMNNSFGFGGANVAVAFGSN